MPFTHSEKFSFPFDLLQIFNRGLWNLQLQLSDKVFPELQVCATARDHPFSSEYSVIMEFSVDRAQKKEAAQAVTTGLQWCTWASISAVKHHGNIQHDHVKDPRPGKMLPVFSLRIPKEKQEIKGKPAAALWTPCWTACSSTDSERLYSTGRQTAWACSVYSFGARDRWWVQLQKDVLPQMSSRGRSVLCLQLKRWQLLLPTYVWLWHQHQKWS